jgi:hypothetical protein
MLRTGEAWQVQAFGRNQDNRARRKKARAPRLMTGESVRREPPLKFERIGEEHMRAEERSEAGRRKRGHAATWSQLSLSGLLASNT